LPVTLPRVHEIGMDGMVAGFAVVLAVGTGILCGLAPAFAALRTTVNDALRQSGRGGQSAGHARLRSGLIVGEIAVAMVLLTSAGLLLKSFRNMQDVDPGFVPEHVITGAYTLPSVRYGTQEKINRFHDELLSKLEELPGVKAAGLASSLPMAEPGSVRFFEAEADRIAPGVPNAAEANAYVVGDFLRAMQVRLLRGRYFDEQRDTADGPLVTIVNRSLAERYWPGQDPIGKRIRWTPGSKIKRPWMTVVGEVADTKQGALDSGNMPQAYEPLAQFNAEFGVLASKLGLHGGTMRVAVRTAYDPVRMESAMRHAVQTMDSQLPLSNVQSMEQAIGRTEAPRRFNTTVLLLFAVMAIGLAALGVYAVTAFSVTQRTHEIGIRVALGARTFQVMGLVVSGGLRLGLLGCVLGVLGAVATSNLLDRFLFQVSPFDVPVYCVAVAGMLLLAGVASFVPALRATTVDPMEALRVE
jgi:putative ABC transport system permease protein